MQWWPEKILADGLMWDHASLLWLCVCVCMHVWETEIKQQDDTKKKDENVFRDSSYHPSVPLSASAHPCLSDTKQTLRESSKSKTQCDPLIYRKQLWQWMMIWFHEDNGDCMLISHQNSTFGLSVWRCIHSLRLRGDKHFKYPDIILLVWGRTILSMRKLYSKLH